MFKCLIDRLSLKRTLNTTICLKRNLNQYRSHYCNELNIDDVGKEVTICGWLKNVRFNKFLIVKDPSDIIQVHVDENIKINDLSMESVIKINGIVRARPRGQENLELKTGKIEIDCKKIEIINKCKQNLPFSPIDNSLVTEPLRLKYRYLDLRNQMMHQNIIFRSNFVASVRNFFNENKFLDIETPTLFRRTPGGAREFIVPTRYEKKFYSLTQSPQQFKQLLMCAGFEKYYQIARCYRDEELKSDRQPEFTQIDIEMSFINEENCIELIESLMDKCWPLSKTHSIQVPFKRMKFDDAIKYYGSDKPDLRFDMKFKCLTEFLNENNDSGLGKIQSNGLNNCGYAFKFSLDSYIDKNELLKYEKFEKMFRDCVNNIELNKEFVFLIIDNSKEKSGNRIVSKFMNDDFYSRLINHLDMNNSNEIAFILISKKENEMKLLDAFGKFRIAIANYVDNLNLTKSNGKAKLFRDPNIFEFLWVVDFPLFTLNTETGEYETTHHPFTAPKPEFVDALMNKTCNLSEVKGQHYDLVLNGCEIAGGSIRIHNAELQRYILNDILKEDCSLLEHLIEALGYGAPPHGGIAIGLDRLMSILCKTVSIRDVIAFPKYALGRDLMSDAPSFVPKTDLEFYKIKLND